MALMFGHANALCIGVFISIIYIECWGDAANLLI